MSYFDRSEKELIRVIQSFIKIHKFTRVVVLFQNEGPLTETIQIDEKGVSNFETQISDLTHLNSDQEIYRDLDFEENDPRKIFSLLDIDILAPVKSPDKYTVFLGVSKLDKNFSESDIGSVRLLVSIVGQFIKNEYLSYSLNRSTHQAKQMITELGALHEISRMFESVLNLDVLLKYVLEKCMELMNAEAASSMMVVEGTDELEFKIVLGPNSEDVKPFRLKIGKGISGWVAENNEPVLIPDAYQDSRFDPSFDKRSGFRTRSMLCVPLTYKAKPIGVMTILNRKDGNPFTENDKNLLTTFASQAALAIENAQLLQAALEKERLDKELQVAAEIQRLIIPQTIPKINGVEISATYIPCKEVSGDFYDIIPLTEDECVFVVADVSGKGIPGAMLVSTMQASLKSYLEYSTDLLSILNNLNNRIIHNTTDDRFITFFFGLYNSKDSTLTYINAGHNPPLIMKPDKTVDYLRTGGIFIGYMPWKYEIATVRIAEESVFVLFTDGLIEAMDDAGEEFGDKRLEEVLSDNLRLNMSDLKEKIISSVRSHLGNNKLDDDFTLVLVRKTTAA